MKTLVDYISDIVGQWDPITETGSHFYGIDPKFIIGSVLLIVIVGGFFGLVRAVIRSR